MYLRLPPVLYTRHPAPSRRGRRGEPVVAVSCKWRTSLSCPCHLSVGPATSRKEEPVELACPGHHRCLFDSDIYPLDSIQCGFNHAEMACAAGHLSEGPATKWQQEGGAG